MSADEIRILLVTDQQMMREGLRSLIADTSGLSLVGEAFDAQSAIQQVRTLIPQLVLMDFDLPEAGGAEITHQILAEFPLVKVIALGSDFNRALVREALCSGVSGCVSKGQGFDELIRAIHAVMDFRIHLSPEIFSMVIRVFIESSADKVPAHDGSLLTKRERLLLQLVAEGKQNKEIAGILAVTVKSVETYRMRLKKKLGCASTPELVCFAIRENKHG